MIPHSSTRDWGAFPWIEGDHYEVGEDGCWNWLRFKMRGYARCAKHGQAHRWGYKMLYGLHDLPLDIEVHHVCENKGCVNPDHLELKEKMRHVTEHAHEWSPLTAEQVVRIRERSAAGEGVEALAHEHGVNHWTISLITRGLSWKSVGGPIFDGNLTCHGCGKAITGRRTKKWCSGACKQRTEYHRRKAAA